MLSLFLNIKREGCVYVEEHVAEVTKIGEGKSLFATKSIYRKPLKNRPNLDVVTTDELDLLSLQISVCCPLKKLKAHK